ncbi:MULTISPECIES: DUF1643 domain-containing protein [Exiguobacterium]|uniref:DUF1643 domain-containing protein n=1 Tax=Exiguobacterium antarcticum TaxID=132920 RepID=A0ABT6R091_9BACL|nr:MULTISPECIES: DUF1643 domain-containing protein [Exiguobacterium]MCT4780202.1 DUF1643 domain-containing protein [Exiguobacterium soli]MDI3234228.1 DUF1643 domain-containing protein [Exiguobacterium antarcticum]
MTQPDRSTLTIEESSIRVQTTFDEAKTKRYLRSYIFDDIADGTHVAALIYTPRTTDAFLSGTTTQRAYNLMKKYVEGPVQQYDIISLIPDLLASEDLPFAQASFDEVNYEFVEQTLRQVKEKNGVVLCGWGSPGRLMHHLPAYENLFDQYADILYCSGITSKGEPNHLRLTVDDSPMITYQDMKLKAKKLKRK